MDLKEFRSELKKAGLEEALEQINEIMKCTLGITLEQIVTNKLTVAPVWQVLYQDKWMKQNGDTYWILQNENAAFEGRKGWVAERTFLTEEAARAALAKLIKKMNRGARVETDVSGGIGVDTLVDEQVANDMQIIHWKIRKQYKTTWEEVESR